MDSAYVIGNGESRSIFPIEDLKDKGVVWGCNAIYRDHPTLCDNIVAVNPPMYDEVKAWYEKENPSCKLYGIEDVSKWDFILDLDHDQQVPEGLKLYRKWSGTDVRNPNKGIKVLDFTTSRGSGCSAVLLAAESGVKNIFIIAFDIIGAKQWQYDWSVTSREQNNIYKNSENYPSRMNMKAYLKYEWLFQLRQIWRKFPNTNFYLINRKENLEGNKFLPGYCDQKNIKCGTYADLRRWVDGNKHFKGFPL